MRYELHVASTKDIKVDAAKNAVADYNRQHGFGPLNIDDEALDKRSLPEDGKRPTQPIAILGYRAIRSAAKTRVRQFEQVLPQHEGPKEGTRRFIVAQESGLKVNNPFLWPVKGMVNDVTVTVIKDLDTKKRMVSAVSSGVRVKLRDVKAVLAEDGGRWNNTIGKAIKKRYARMGIDINDVDWYQEYSPKNHGRGYYIEQSTRRAFMKLP